MDEQLAKLIEHLNQYKTSYEHFGVTVGKSYYKIVIMNTETNKPASAYAFVVRHDFRTRTLGKCNKGDIHKPAGWSQPAKHARGSLFDESTWGCCGRYGVMSLK